MAVPMHSSPQRTRGAGANRSKCCNNRSKCCNNRSKCCHAIRGFRPSILNSEAFRPETTTPEAKPWKDAEWSKGERAAYEVDFSVTVSPSFSIRRSVSVTVDVLVVVKVRDRKAKTSGVQKQAHVSPGVEDQLEVMFIPIRRTCSHHLDTRGDFSSRPSLPLSHHKIQINGHRPVEPRSADGPLLQSSAVTLQSFSSMLPPVPPSCPARRDNNPAPSPTPAAGRKLCSVPLVTAG